MTTTKYKADAFLEQLASAVDELRTKHGIQKDDVIFKVQVRVELLVSMDEKVES